MNCTCIEDVEKKLAEFRKPIAGDDAEARMKNIAWAITDSQCVTVIDIPFVVKGSKKGYTSKNGKIETVRASFCPFCGESTKIKEPA